MLIANPIYDVVFKYLLEDIEIARELLSTILGEEVVGLDLKPQESTIENSAAGVSILRFDFKAIIKTQSGEYKKALIELQKAKQAFDAIRFRRYLGDNYQKEDEILDDNGESKKAPLPIVTIYFLGFPLDNIKSAVVKINREYRDVITQELLNVKEDFVELLTHDSYLIQLKLLEGKSRTKLEKVLQIFSSEFKTEDKHLLDFKGDLNDPLVQKMVVRLGRAIASEEIRNIMDIEDEIDRAFERATGKLYSIIAAKEQEIELERQKTETERQKAEAERQKAEAERQKAEAERQKAEAERQKAENLLKELEELRKQMKK
ncbi:MAG: hypothetical protein MUE30_06655 [Spirosomaceae bacterium]|jgi:hypothetical protein|nr:hypothetical protein [Spirosomataceae bacterium]